MNPAWNPPEGYDTIIGERGSVAFQAVSVSGLPLPAPSLPIHVF